jgi:carbohydrate-selective porin OprB
MKMMLPLALTSSLAFAEPSPLSEWWSGRYASGNWFGVRDGLSERGVDLNVNWRANFLAIVDGGLQQRGGLDQEINFDLGVDIAKLTGWDAIEGLSFTGNIRWREATYSINRYAGTDGTFRPSAYTGGAGWRFRKFYLSYTTPELFGIEDLLTLSGGWQVPTDLFLVQPESKLFVNQSIRTAKGINPNLPWGGSFSTWGGYLRLQPTAWLYAQSGLYLAYPFGADPRNHALSFAGYQIDPSLNGLYAINEVGVTPEIGASRLPGKYAAGFIYWGVEQTGFDGVPYDGNFQFYWQADQQLYREPTSAAAEPDGKEVAGKSFKAPVETQAAKPNPQGLYFFSTLQFAPPANNVLSFYLLGGLVYKGLLPGRDQDQLGVAFAYGNYSFDARQADEGRGRDPRTYQAVFEVDYRIQFNRFAYVQPTFQYIINPGGRGLVANDTIIGLHFGANF